MFNTKVLIIAEAGVNHNGDFQRAIELMEKAAEAGADYVKFQTFKADKIVSKEAKKAEYQINNMRDDEDSQYSMLKKLEIPYEWYPKLIQKASDLGIGFLSTGFDEESIDMLDSWNPSFYKIPSGEITNKPYLQHIAKKGKPIIISTGMADLSEIKDAVQVLSKEVNKDMISVLHCNTEYPTPMKDVNLLAMHHIRDELGVQVGYSDHTLGIEVPIAAVALGAKVIEKHFTLDRSLPGPDHAASLQPDELKAMVIAIRNIEMAISGRGVKEPSASELNNKVLIRKSIHLSKDLKEGDTINKSNLISLRPGDGLSPMKIDEIIGKKVNRDLAQYHKITLSDLQ